MNRVTVTIAGRAYTLLAEESKEYMDKVAELVNTKIKAINPDWEKIDVAGPGRKPALPAAKLY